ncbi:unnamed protein product [Phaedon cochleariae]|uniref:Uncharacterized protein n=1 Tax=Phaedon cochleariae TaxID=80249 RepID=A0A9P0DUE2_PHACE|nr:unnamed protein product [Phaedon cochleariae]
MPQGASEKFLATSNIYPLLPSNSQIVLQDDLGLANPIDVTDVAVIPHRELVNLENAAVNIDNSTDVIIGPVTQFNVNGNVIIRQHENGGRLGLGLGLDHDEEKKNGGVVEGSAGAAKLSPSPTQTHRTKEDPDLEWKRKLVKILLFLALGLVAMLTTAILVAIFFHPNDSQFETDPPTTSQIPLKRGHQVFVRLDWNARPPKYRLLVQKPLKMVVIKHTGGRTCDQFRTCSKVIQTLQSQDAAMGNPDIYCNFLIGGDGNVYEGRGWGVQNEYLNDTVDIVLMGTYDIDVPSAYMLDAALALMDDGETRKYLSEDYRVVCHNQTYNTLSPGSNVFKEVKKWQRYDPGMYFEKTLLRKRKTIVHLVLWLTLAALLFTATTVTLLLTLKTDPPPDVIPPPAPRPISNDQTYQFYRREDWGARKAKWRTNITKPVDLVVIKHTGGKTCDSFQACAPLLQTLQSLSVQRGNPDIYCSFLIGLDGDVYEGRGWGVQPQERNDTYDIVFTGSFDIDEPEKRMFGAVQALLQDGVRRGFLSEGFKVVCHSQTMNTISPGVHVCGEVRKWPHYDPGMYFPNVLMNTPCSTDKTHKRYCYIHEPISREPDPKTTNKKIKYTTWMSLGLVLIVVPTVIVKLQPIQSTQTEPPTIISPTPACMKCQQKYITRQTWHGSPPKSQKIQSEPAKLVILKHTAGLFCTTTKDCSTLTRNIQDYHFFLGAPDIWYNFLIGGDGRIYVGRGFGVQNQFTNDTLDIAIHGNFSYDEFFPDMIQATRSLIEQGLLLGHLAKDYRVVCHNQTMLKTSSPVLNVKPNHPRIFLTLLDHIRKEKTRIALIVVFVIITIAAISTYLTLSSHPEECSEKNNCKKGDHDHWEADQVGNYSIYSKKQWGGAEPKSVRPLPLPIGLVIISHSVTSACDNFDSCSRIVRGIQKDHFDINLSDVCYNFLIGGDGSIFEGRGWETRNCHSKLSIGINFIGDFTKMMLNASAIESIRKLLDKGVKLVKIAEDYILIGHNQTMQTLSPGVFAYEVIKRFSHFDDIDLRRS